MQRRTADAKSAVDRVEISRTPVRAQFDLAKRGNPGQVSVLGRPARRTPISELSCEETEKCVRADEHLIVHGSRQVNAEKRVLGSGTG